MKRILWIGVLLGGWLVSAQASAAWFASCAGGSKEPKPEWVSKLDYSLPGYYVGVGTARKVDGKDLDEQIRMSEEHAKSRLVQQIEVKIKSEISQSVSESNGEGRLDASSKVTVSADEVLRGLKIKARWIDPESCAQYTLMVISEKAIAVAKNEKTMKKRLDDFKVLLAKGSDRGTFRDIKVRRKFLGEAQALLAGTDFSVLPEEAGKDFFEIQLKEALEAMNKESSQVKGRMAIFAINQDGRLRTDLIGKMLDQLRSSDSTTDRLMADCETVQECINNAREKGFAKLALLKAGSQVGTSPMGALKGTLTVSRTVYDIESQKIVKGPDVVSTQVIGWSNEELDWDTAAEKAMEGLK